MVSMNIRDRQGSHKLRRRVMTRTTYGSSMRYWKEGKAMRWAREDRSDTSGRESVWVSSFKAGGAACR